MVDLHNHRRFSLRCLKYVDIPVSEKLKTNIRTSRGLQIIGKEERKLLNECIRSITFHWNYTCIGKKHIFIS